jgi:hypothetical protein
MSLTLYFFLYPAGHFGFIAVTFLVILPFTQEIVLFFKITADGDGEGLEEMVGAGDGFKIIFS